MYTLGVQTYQMEHDSVRVLFFWQILVKFQGKNKQFTLRYAL